METINDRRRGMLVGLAVGDALGAAVEFQPRGSFQPVVRFQGGGPFGLAPGEWTDDTSMALALADSIASAGWDLNDQAGRYLDWYRTGRYSVNGRCFDIGNQTRAALQRFERDRDASASGDPSDLRSGNGSIMRLAPVPIAFARQFPRQTADLARRAEESSVPTHPSPMCRSACRYLGVVLAALAMGEGREVVLAPDWPHLEEMKPLHPAVAAVAAGSFRHRSEEEIRGSGFVVQSLEAALWAFHEAHSFQEAVLAAVNLGEDSDTTGAVCGQLAGAYFGESGIPAEWREELARRDMVEAALGALDPDLTLP
jgi:ADP-ribosyl-[dinitrogen reductase] hydrolase